MYLNLLNPIFGDTWRFCALHFNNILDSMETDVIIIVKLEYESNYLSSSNSTANNMEFFQVSLWIPSSYMIFFSGLNGSESWLLKWQTATFFCEFCCLEPFSIRKLWKANLLDGNGSMFRKENISALIPTLCHHQLHSLIQYQMTESSLQTNFRVS